MRVISLALFLFASGLEGIMSFDWGAVAAIVAALSLLISVFNTRGKSNTAHIQRTVKESIYEFREVLGEQLDQRFTQLRAEYLDKEKVDLRFQLLQQSIKSDHDAFLRDLGQIDHRVKRNSDTNAMLLGEILKLRRPTDPPLTMS